MYKKRSNVFVKLITFAIVCLLSFSTTKLSAQVIYQYNHRMSNTTWTKNMNPKDTYRNKIITNVSYLKSSNVELDVRPSKTGELYIFHDNNLAIRGKSNLSIWNQDDNTLKSYDVMTLKSWISGYGKYVNKAMIEFKVDPRYSKDKLFLNSELKKMAMIIKPIKNKVIINSFNIDYLSYFRSQGFKVYLDLQYENLSANLSKYNKLLDGIFLNVRKMGLKYSKGNVNSTNADFNNFMSKWHKGLFLWNVNEGYISNVDTNDNSEFMITKWLLNHQNHFSVYGTILNKLIGHYSFNEIAKETGLNWISNLRVSRSRKFRIFNDFLFYKNHYNYYSQSRFNTWKSHVLRNIK